MKMDAHGFNAIETAFFSLPEIVHGEKALPDVKQSTVDKLWAEPRRWGDMVAVLVEDWKHGERPCGIVAWKPTAPEELYFWPEEVTGWYTLGRIPGVEPVEQKRHMSVLSWLQDDLNGLVIVT